MSDQKDIDEQNNEAHDDNLIVNALERSSQNNKPVPKARLDPTRYGDWEKNGRCIDF